MVVRVRVLVDGLVRGNTHACAPAEPFEDEVHPRLRFPHRGLVAMANNGTKNANESQFFITLGMFPRRIRHFLGGVTDEHDSCVRPGG